MTVMTARVLIFTHLAAESPGSIIPRMKAGRDFHPFLKGGLWPRFFALLHAQFPGSTALMKTRQTRASTSFSHVSRVKTPLQGFLNVLSLGLLGRKGLLFDIGKKFPLPGRRARFAPA